MKLLVVEDNAALNSLVTAHLRDRGIEADCVFDGGTALRAAGEAPYDAIILDLGLPDMDGMDVLRALRKSGTVPVLIVTARDAVAQRIAGLDAGADDYILKPFDLAEFEARLRAVLRRPGARATPPTRFGDLSFDSACQAARAGGRAVELTRREATLLEELIRHGERIAVRDALAERLYGDSGEVSGNALEATVSRLRRKLASLGSDVSIETIRGIGYRLHRLPLPQ
jgi:DNA-binding response OmpR family regulator